ncbi:MAG: glycine--tRNA ligase subunit beta [Gammaproteobacteria bacterium]|nr:MAG: glycine--tRNA ligase subunit beta [Gammaproteobacteria bacterium]
MTEPTVDCADFLLEIGTEELPPRALGALAGALREGLGAALGDAGLGHGAMHEYATPRRLAVVVEALASAQPDREVEKRGPPVRIAFDADGQPTRAAQAFAESCGVPVTALAQLETDRGSWLVHRAVAAGESAAVLLPAMVAKVVDELPVPKRMRWGAGTAEFARPVHWIIMLHGTEVIPGELFGLPAGRVTYGHRFMAPAALELATPDEYVRRLEAEGRVVASLTERRRRLLEACQAAAREAQGTLVADEALLDEITALVEWPVPVIGRFDPAFLELPDEVLIATLQGHQRYLPLRGADGALLPAFIAVANIESREPAQVRAGNERVVRPRLADAAFFYRQDRAQTLASRVPALDAVVFQHDLGSVRDKSLRVAAAAHEIALATGGDTAMAEHAAQLAKCDLVTEMVGEFPELQGRMGREYAALDGEPADVAAAIEEQYLPRFAGDRLPATRTGQTLALADKLDTLAGIFAIGQRPSGTRDPFGLRRAAVGLLRILIEGEIDLDLTRALGAALARQPVAVAPGLADELYDYIMERLRAYYADTVPGGEITAEMLDAVLALRPASPLDVHRRLAALKRFLQQEAAASLAAANKRVANLLRKAAESGETVVADEAPDSRPADAEGALAARLQALGPGLEAAAAARDYDQLLALLARLREPVDRFFEDIMVMAEEPAVRARRLSLLASLREAFCRVADFSRLPG